MKITLNIPENELKLIQKLGIDPAILIKVVAFQVVDLLKVNTEIYTELIELDEEMIIEKLIILSEVKKTDRINRFMKRYNFNKIEPVPKA